MEIRSGRHSRYLILYHMVWIPKYRRTVLEGPIADRLKEIIQETAKERGWEIIAMEVMPDHVHLFASVPPTIRPADVVKVFKGVSARKLLLEFPHLQKRTGRGTLWAPSYFMATAGNVSAETIRRYIEEQRQKGGG
ncbi:IS200/IS605 family transposase [Hydrogenibacillus schlegelii]|uniref:Transposase n=2 Tax=Hydrogenibacillus schlegelii TaxID=1484 RepID=A0A179IR43_HYDSH|nr:IS200/IS605 family transposase [Hydrogenibacillus schlegelii]OAR04795.1 transposase [Hydrogenibacillus schlegelii]